MSRSSSGFVAGLTAVALAAVGFLAYQASANVPDQLGKDRPEASASSSKTPAEKSDPKALPAESGSGARVVYALDSDRVWLVGSRNKVQRTFEVTPSTVDPLPGKYAVTSRSGTITGSDGVPIEHVVRFANNEGVAIGFSAAVDGSTASPDPEKKTGGIRESRADGSAMWKFAEIGRPVIVVP
ncbi:hypothetical protein DY218_05030 [Streptomyces triticagri]|uniref:L,D-transpeptidase n=1 Tax=Streptomyces triticagri TaxID=2293568 RepID=A0A372M9M2_9ACTN|nr:hypothetical protein [Streptomyces triticagri]RFU87632.1 hypothetical protein DY218_05030 [Streptomyces triticagri]